MRPQPDPGGSPPAACPGDHGFPLDTVSTKNGGPVCRVEPLPRLIRGVGRDWNKQVIVNLGCEERARNWRWRLLGTSPSGHLSPLVPGFLSVEWELCEMMAEFLTLFASLELLGQ